MIPKCFANLDFFFPGISATAAEKKKGKTKNSFKCSTLQNFTTKTTTKNF